MRDAKRIGVAVLAVAIWVVASMATVARAEPIEQPQRVQVRHFSFFATESEGLPGWQQRIGEYEEAEEKFPNFPFLRGCEGLNADLAQKVEGIPGRRVFIIPGDGCMLMVNMGPVTQPYPMLSGVSWNRGAIKHGMETGGSRGIGYGIAPDGAIAAKLSPTLTVPVRQGTFFVVPYGDPDASSFWTQARMVFGASAGGG